MLRRNARAIVGGTATRDVAPVQLLSAAKLMALALESSFGRYRIEEIAGHGASSIVYRATDTLAGGAVALKCVREELLVPAEREATLARLTREAGIGERLVHPGIVRTFEHGEREGLPYIAMEYVGGDNLDELLRRSGSLPLATLGRIVTGILDALAYAHAHAIVHRDVKPANVLLRSARGDPVLTDFGIARARASELTHAGDLLGSPAFMAPEQVRGEAVDHRIDLFATGVLLYLAATGRLPFAGGSIAAVMYQILLRRPGPALEPRPQARGARPGRGRRSRERRPTPVRQRPSVPRGFGEGVRYRAVRPLGLYRCRAASRRSRRDRCPGRPCLGGRCRGRLGDDLQAARAAAEIGPTGWVGGVGGRGPAARDAAADGVGGARGRRGGAGQGRPGATGRPRGAGPEWPPGQPPVRGRGARRRRLRRRTRRDRRDRGRASPAAGGGRAPAGAGARRSHHRPGAASGGEGDGGLRG